MSKCITPFAWRGGTLLLGVLSLFVLGGCGSSASEEPVQADPVAQSDPDAKARELLAEFQALPPGEEAAWINENTFALSVFETVTDPQLKEAYRQQILPHMQ